MQSLLARAPRRAATRCGLASFLVLAAAATAYFLPGIGQSLSREHAPGDASPAASLQAQNVAEDVTLFEGAFEVFYELPPLVERDEVDIAFHLSDASLAEPIADAKVVLELDLPKGPNLIPTRAGQPGVYVARLACGAAGEYAARLTIARGERREIVSLPTLKVFRSLPEAVASRDTAAAAAASPIAFTKEQQWRLRTLTEPVSERELVERLTAPGKVIAAPGSDAQVTPPAPGTLLVAAGEPFPRVGEHVSAGQVLAMLEPSAVGGSGVQLLANQAQLETLDAELAVKQTQVETQIRGAEEEVSFAEKALERFKTLAASGTTSARTQYEAQLALDLATIRLQGARQQLQPYTDARARLASLSSTRQNDSTSVDRSNLRVPLISPVSGTLVESHATAGQFLNQGDRIFEVIDMSRVWIEARVSEFDFARVQQAPAASYRLSAYPDQLFPIFGEGGGRLVDVGVVVETASRTLPVRYELPNPQGRLRIGMFAEVLVETERREKTLAISEAALVDDAGETTVYVQRSGETFEKRPVRIGIRDGGWVEIVDGLNPGERIVTRGAFAIRLASMSSGMPEHGHDH